VRTTFTHAAILCLCLAVSATRGEAAQRERSAPAAKPVPARLESYQVPAGSALLLKLRTPIHSGSAAVDDQVEAVLWSPVIQDGVELIPVDSVVLGKVIEVVRATERKPLGAVTFAFSIIEHAETGSRAMVNTRKITIEAPLPAEPQGRRGKGKPKPVEATMKGGAPFVAMTAEPLIVRIPR
jgi:hypothetical protein